MLPNVLQPREADHVPVLAEEVRACLAVEPGDTVIDATFGAGGHASLLAADLRGKGELIAIDRDPTARTYFEQLAKRTTANTRLRRGGFRRGPAQPPAGSLRRRPAAARGERRPRGRDPARSRRLLDAARPPGARVLVRRRRAARHAHRSEPGRERLRRRERLERARARHHLPRLR